MSEWDEDNLFDPCYELDCVNHEEDGPSCEFCEYDILRREKEKADKLVLFYRELAGPITVEEAELISKKMKEMVPLKPRNITHEG